MEIRNARPQDVPALLHLLEQVNLVHHNGRPDLFKLATKYGEKELLSILSDPQTPVFVAIEDEKVLGHAFCVIKTVQKDRLLCDVKTLYIDDICVEEEARGRGIGQALYAHAEAFARRVGCYNVTLNVWTCNPGAMRFYERLGLAPQKVGMERIL